MPCCGLPAQLIVQLPQVIEIFNGVDDLLFLVYYSINTVDSF
jgi:hypothetical protein